MAMVKNIYIQDDVAHLIKEELNLSKLIGELLRNHYDELKTNNITLEQVNLEIKKLELDEEYKKKKELLNK